MRSVMLTAILLAQLSANAAAASCAGADPAIMSVKVQNVAGNGSVNHYTLVGKVTNLGREAGIKRLAVRRHLSKRNPFRRPRRAAAGAGTIVYLLLRSGSAQATRAMVRRPMHFSLRMTSPSPPGNEDCNPGNDTYNVTF